MERRAFLRTGLAAGALAAGSDVLLASELAAATRRRRLAPGPLRLNANENPLGLCPAAREAVRAGIGEANRYPFAARDPVISRLAARHQVEPDSILLGTGSTEVLQMVVQTFGRDGAMFIIPDPTFEDVPGYARPWDVDLRKVPLTANYRHDLDRMQELAGSTTGPVVVYICNPNNPTATVTPSVDTDSWILTAPERVTFLVDEAYFEYAAASPGYWSATKWVGSRPNVIVTRTFSKIFGMAGMRLGYGIAHPDTAARLRQLQSRNNANYLALAAAVASLDDPALVDRGLEVNDRGRLVAERALESLNLQVIPSHANFLMHEIPGDLDPYIARMRKAGIRVGRPFPPMLGHNRLSIGTPEEMERWAETLRGFRRRGWI